MCKPATISRASASPHESNNDILTVSRDQLKATDLLGDWNQGRVSPDSVEMDGTMSDMDCSTFGVDVDVDCWNKTSYQDLKAAFLNTDDFMGGMAAQQVFQRVEDALEEMVEEDRYDENGSVQETNTVDQDIPSENDVAQVLLLLKR